MSVKTRLLEIKGQPSQMFVDRQLSPFPIIETIGNYSFRLPLPPKLKMHPVSHVNSLRPCPTAPIQPVAPVVPVGSEEDPDNYSMHAKSVAELQRISMYL